MRDFDVYSPEDIIAKNLAECEQRKSLVQEQELAHLYELAAEIAQTRELSELLTSLPDHRPSLLPSEHRAIKVPDLLHSSQSRQQTHTKAMLCLALHHTLSQERAIPVGAYFSDAEEPTPTAYQRIVYQRSGYTDAAYLQLSALLSEPRAAYSHSFLSACEEVYNGHCEYCILPLENSTEGQLGSFSRLIERYDLKIAATCDIVGNDTGRVTRFALLHKHILPLFHLGGTEAFFECSLPLGNNPDVTDVLYAAQLCGMRLYRIDSQPRQGGDTQFSVHLSFRIANADLQAFLLYLAMEVPHYTPIGLYPHLQTKGK